MNKKICEYCKEEHLKDNIGCNNSGYYNSGDYNSGNYNSGDYNSGYRNSGYRNSGYRNSGDYNSGDYNSGDYNSGYYNSGYRNSGDYNSGYRNSGWFNTNEPKMRFFNKDSDLTYSEFSSKLSFVYPDLKITAWVELNDLPTDKQSEFAKQMGGLLKTLTYKEAWTEYWNRASKEDKEWFTKLPNFSEEIFEEITGISLKSNQESDIKINAPQSMSGKTVKVEIDGVKYEAIIK